VNKDEYIYIYIYIYIIQRKIWVTDSICLKHFDLEAALARQKHET